MTETRKRLQKNGSNMGYDRKCLGLSKEEREEKLNKGEKSIVRFKVTFPGFASSWALGNAVLTNTFILLRS